MTIDDGVCRSRRRFIELCTLSMGTISGLSAAGCSGGSAGPAQVGNVDAGNVADLQVGTLKAIRRLPVAIGRDAGGLYAMTLTCPHEGCNMAIDGSVSIAQVFCSCHGSTFDSNGNVTGGPAHADLAHFSVDVDVSGQITIHGDQEVTSDERTPVS